VKLGGEYFSPLDGGYYLLEDDSGNTVLTLKTRLIDNTSFGVYSVTAPLTPSNPLATT
jgi:hypothetical protein